MNQKIDQREMMKVMHLILILGLLVSVVTAEDTESIKDSVAESIYPFGGEETRTMEKPCDPNPCLQENQGICVIVDGQVDCLCNPGFEFDENGNCIVEGTFVVDPCDPNPCNEQNRGVCIDVNGEAVCLCDPAYNDVGDGRCIAESSSDEYIGMKTGNKSNLTSDQFSKITKITFESAPEMFRNMYGDERINVYVDGAEFYLITKEGSVYETGEGNLTDPSINLYTDDETIQKLASGETTLIKALDDGSITVKGVGLLNDLKIGTAEFFAAMFGWMWE